MSDNEKRTPPPDSPRTPEGHEQLKRQFLDVVNEFIAASPKDLDVLRKVYALGRPQFRWYEVAGITEWNNDNNIDSFPIAKQDEGGGWLGCQVSKDELWLLPVYRQRFSTDDAFKFINNFVSREGWERTKLDTFDGFTNAQEPVVMRPTEPHPLYLDPGRREAYTKAAFYRLEKRGVIQPRVRGQSPDPEYARRTVEKATRIRESMERMKEEDQRKAEARAAAQRTDLSKLLELIATMKGDYERLAEEQRRQEEILKTKEFPLRTLSNNLIQLREQVLGNRPDCKTIDARLDALGYEYPSLYISSKGYVGSLETFKRHKQLAEQVRAQLGWLERTHGTGKAARAYLSQVIRMLSDAALEKVRQAEADVAKTRRQFDEVNKAASAKARQDGDRRNDEILKGIESYKGTDMLH